VQKITGKSELVRYLSIKNDNIIVSTSTSLTYNTSLLRNYIKNGGDIIGNWTFIFDISSTSREKINYNTFECLKNGMILTMKYKYYTLLLNPPHVIVLSNMYPNVAKMSADRWKIFNIKDKKIQKM
jgi:hypothetical protein